MDAETRASVLIALALLAAAALPLVLLIVGEAIP
jgi:hypothetical protein